MQNHLLTDFDAQFENLYDLNWMPWIGNNYPRTKLLILGDSHYDDGESWLEDRNATRNMIKNQGLNSFNPNFSNAPGFRNVEKTILYQPSTSFEEREIFWSSVSYFNLVQRLLPSRQKGDRPTESDFDNGWKTVLEIAKIIKPTVCIKLGIDGIGRLGNYLNINITSWDRNTDEFYRKPYIINLQNDSCAFKIIFINHPTGSYGFDYEYWANVIQNEVPDLKQKIKP